MTEGRSRPAPPPRLRHRPLRRPDVPEIMALLPAWLDIDATQRLGIHRLWERLADHPAAVVGVAEDLSEPPGRRLQSWGATLIMPNAWLHSIMPSGAVDPQRGADACRQIYLALLAETLQPPAERDIGSANAGDGVVFMALHYRQRVMDLSDPYALRVLNLTHEAFRMMHSGYRVKAFVQQALMSDEPWLVSAGFRRLHAPLCTTPERQTVLYGITRDEAASILPGSSARHIFDHQAPQFRLSASQRRLLWLALFDERDEFLMELLEVSVHGLKKLWRGIYERIEDVEPEFFGDVPDPDEGKRGPEKRRQVLAYVRQRPEELRPWTPG